MFHFVYAAQYYMHVYGFWVTIIWHNDNLKNCPKHDNEYKRNEGKRQSAIPLKRQTTLKIHRKKHFECTIAKLVLF